MSTGDEARDAWHLTFGLISAIIAFLFLVYGWRVWGSAILVGIVDVYILMLIIEAALRSKKNESRPKSKVMFEYPSRLGVLFQFAFLLLIVISGFGNMYFQLGRDAICPSAKPVVDCAIQKVAPEPKGKSPQVRETVGKPSVDAHVTVKPDLKSWGDAAYFSAITLTTFGGSAEFAPPNSNAKGLVLWEIFTGMMLLLCAFPLLISRLSDF
jgi:hypothetical protein